MFSPSANVAVSSAYVCVSDGFSSFFNLWSDRDRSPTRASARSDAYCSVFGGTVAHF